MQKHIAQGEKLWIWPRENEIFCSEKELSTQIWKLPDRENMLQNKWLIVIQNI